MGIVLAVALTIVVASKDLWDKLYICFTGALVVIGAGTWILLWWQAKKTAKSADAAHLTAQSLINSERPWLVVEVVRHENLPNEWFYRITNKGKTPAIIVSAFSERATPTTPDGLPLPPKYSSPMYSPESDVRMPNDPWIDHPRFNPEAMLNSGGRAEFAICHKFLCFYGQITYRDTFGRRNSSTDEHYTRWCYCYEVEQGTMISSGPEEYRRKT